MLKKAVLLIFSLFLIFCCSVKRNNLKNRTHHGVNASFNMLFNGNMAFEEELKKFQDDFTDDFTLPIRVEKMPIILKNDTLQVKEQTIDKKDALRAMSGYMVFNEDEKEKTVSGFEKAIYKANKSIAYHSMKIDNKEYNPSMFKAYQLIGKVRYYRGKPSEAIEAFEYAKEIAKKKKHKEQLDLWIAKSDVQLGNFKAAENIYKNLTKTKNKKILKQDLLNYIQLDLDLEKYKEAYPLLQYELVLEKNKKIKSRLLFLTAQVQDLLNLKKDALENYVKLRKYKPEDQLKLKSYTNYILINNNIENAEAIKLEKKLNSYLDNSVLFEFKDELYYALALLKEKKNDSINAKLFYNKSLKEFGSDQDIRMSIYKRYAEKNFDSDKYRISKKYYDSSMTAARKEKKYIFKDRLGKLTKLDSIYENYTVKDSIVSLLRMNNEDRKSYFLKHIEKLKKADESAKEKGKIDEITTNNNKERELYNVTGKDETNKWYFYNTKLVLKGNADFITKWGKRSSNNNWRRNINQVINKEIEPKIADSIKVKKDDGLLENKYDTNFYTSKIPTDEKEIFKITHDRDSIQLKLGLAYYTLFKNSKKALFYLEDLVLKEPKNAETVQKTYFNLFKIYRDLKQEDQYNKYKQLILDKFPNTIYAAYVSNPTDFILNKSNEASVAIYEKAYNLYKDNKQLDALGLIESSRDIYIKQGIAPKYALLKAYILGYLKGEATMVFELKKLELLYENSDEAKKAKEIINTFKKVKSKTK